MPTSIRGDFSHISAANLRPYLGPNLAPLAEDFVEAGQTYGLDPRFLASVSKLETDSGKSKAFREGNNAMGISTRTGPRYDFASPRDSIFAQAKTLARPDGYYKNANTIAEIGQIYAPPGAENDPRGTNGGWPELVAKNYREMLGGTPKETRGPLRAVPTNDTADTLEATGARDAMTPDRAGDGVPRDALTQSRRRAEPERNTGAGSPSQAAGPGTPPIPKWSEITKDTRWRHSTLDERRAVWTKYQAEAAKYADRSTPEAARRWQQMTELEGLKVEYQDPEASILDAVKRGALNTKSALDLRAATQEEEEMAAASAELARVRMKLRPGEALFAGPAKTLDLKGDRAARVLAGNQEQGIYAVPPNTPGAVTLEQYTDDIKSRLHGGGERRKAALAASIEAGDLAQSLPTSRAVREFMETEGGSASAWVLAKNFLPIAAHTLAESAAGIAAPVAGGMAGGAAGGPVGAAAGGAAGGFAVEYAASYRDFLHEAARERGLDPETPEGLLGAIQTPEIVREARNRAAQRGVPIAAVDAMTSGLAAKLGGKLGKQFAANLAMDASGGAAGELAAQAASGQAIDPKAAALESIGQVATGVGQATGRAVAKGISDKFGPAPPPANEPPPPIGSPDIPLAPEAGDPPAAAPSAPPRDSTAVVPITPGLPLTERQPPAITAPAPQLITPDPAAEALALETGTMPVVRDSLTTASTEPVAPAAPLRDPTAAIPITPEAEGQLIPETEMPFNLAGETTQETTFDPTVNRSEAQQDAAAGHARMFDEAPETDSTLSDPQPNPVTSETSPSPEVAAPAPGRQRARVRLASLDRSDTPVLNFLRETPILGKNSPAILPRLSRIEAAKRTGRPVDRADQDFFANYDGYPKQTNYRRGAQKFLMGMFTNEGQPADVVADNAVRRGILPPGSSVQDLYEALHREMIGLERAQDTANAVGSSLKGSFDERSVAEMQDELAGNQRMAFEQDADFNFAETLLAEDQNRKPKRRRKEAIQASELQVGDILTLKGEALEVTEVYVTEDGNQITLKDGRRYGTQIIEDGDQLFVDVFDPVERPAAPAFNVEDPENVVFSGGILTPGAAALARAGTSGPQGQIKMRHGLPVAAFEARLDATGRKNEILKQVDQTLRRLNYLVSKVTGRGFTTLRGAQSREQVMQALHNALSGAMPITGLAPELRPIAAEMRAAVDGLSNDMIQLGVVEGDLVAILTANEGTYLNRSYRIFEGPEAWAKKVAPNVKARAIGLLRRQFPMAQGEAPAAYQTRVERLLNELLINHGNLEDGQAGAATDSTQTGRMIRNILKKRGDIPVEIRELWGEYTTADVSWARTMARMAQLIASHQYLTEVREAGLGKFLFLPDDPNRPTWAARQIVTTKRDGASAARTLAPLEGLYAHIDVAKALEAMGKSDATGSLMQLWMKFNSAAKIGKTVLNPITQVRNWGAGTLITISLGNFPLRHSTVSARAFISELLPASVVAALERGGYDRGRWESYVRELVANGVLGENVALGDIKASIKDALGGTMSMDEFVQNRGAKLARKALNVPMKLYGAGDGFWRIVNFEGEAGKLRKAFPAMPETEVRTEAARLVRELTPTYSLVWPVIDKFFRRSPVFASFVSFWAEMFRTQANVMKQTAKELATPGYRKIGAGRLAGLLIAHSIPLGLAALGKWAAGEKEEELKALRRLAAPWDANALLLPLGKDGKGNYRFINLSYVDPFASFKKPFIAWMRGDYANPEDALKAGLAELFSPLISEEIFTAALLDIARNRDGKDGGPLVNSQASDVEKVKAYAERLWEAFEPGVFATTERIYKATTGEQNHSRAYNLRDELTALFSGQRIVTVDPLDAIGFCASDFRRQWAESTQIFTQQATSKGTVTQQQLAAQFGDMQQARGALVMNFGADMRAAIRLGAPAEDVAAQARSRGAGETNVNLALQGQMAPYTMSDDTFKRARQIPGRLADIRAAVGDAIFTPKQMEEVIVQSAAGMIVLPALQQK